MSRSWTKTGTIVAVNRAWREFAEANPPLHANVCEGANYMEVCETAVGPCAEGSAAMAAGIRAVMRDEQQELCSSIPATHPKRNAGSSPASRAFRAKAPPALWWSMKNHHSQTGGGGFAGERRDLPDSCRKLFRRHFHAR